MKCVKNLLAALLVLCMVFTLCACGNASDEDPTTVPETTTVPASVENTEPNKETESVDDGKVEYTITVLDEAGNPVVGAMVQMCKDSCLPGPATDAEGKTSFSLVEDTYKVSFIVVPAGYTYVDDVTEFYFEDGATELTITLKVAE